MRAFNILAKRFEWAIKNKKPIHPNAQDIEAINELGVYFHTKKHNENLEDSLILFWVFCNWKIAINGQKLNFKEDKKGALVLPELSSVLDKLCLMMNPKEYIIAEATIDLQISQKQMGHDITITKEIVSEMFEEALTGIKSMSFPISQLHKYEKVIYEYDEEHTQKLKNNLGI